MIGLIAPSLSLAFGLGGAIADDPDADDPLDPVLFEVELQAFLEGRLGQPVHLGLIPEGLALDGAGSAVVLTIVDSSTPLLLSGPSGGTFWRVQFDCYSTAPAMAARTNESIRRVLQPFRGQAARLWIKNAELLTRPGGFDPRGQGQDDGTYRRMSEWRICVREHVPAAS